MIHTTVISDLLSAQTGITGRLKGAHTRIRKLRLPLLLTVAVGLSSAVTFTIARGDTVYASTGGLIEKFTAGGVNSVVALGANSDCLAVDSVGNAFAAGFGMTIEKYSSDGSRTVFADTSPYELEGLAFDSAGNLYASLYDFTTNIIKKFTPAGVGTVFANLDPPGSIAIDPTGNVYVTIGGQAAIEKFTPDGVGSIFAVGSYNSLFGGISDLACDSAGNLYASTYNGNGVGGDRIVKFAPSGDASSFAELGSNEAYGLAVDSAGNLYAAINGIEKFTPDGVGTVFSTFAAGNIAIQTVPEPATVELAGCGFAALAMLKLRRRSVKQAEFVTFRRAGTLTHHDHRTSDWASLHLASSNA
jgi:hypothetical protein